MSPPAMLPPPAPDPAHEGTVPTLPTVAAARSAAEAATAAPPAAAPCDGEVEEEEDDDAEAGGNALEDSPTLGGRGAFP